MMSRPAVLALALSCMTPSLALADEVRALLDGVSVPIGPEGTTVVRVERSLVAGARYAVVRSRELGAPSRCAVPSERVSVWTHSEGRWVEALNQVFDRCPADRRPGIALAVRARVIQWTEGATSATELHVRLLDPRLPASTAPMSRFRRSGDRFVNPQDDAPFAASGEAPTARVEPVTGSTDGRADEWSQRAPFTALQGAGAQRARVWLGAQGSTLRFAARIDAAPDATLTLRLAEPGISTARLRGERGNSGRSLAVRCGAPQPSANPDAQVRCTREGASLFIEGETDLATMLWSRDEVRAVAAHASVSWDGSARAQSSHRLETVALPSAFSVMEGASMEARARCAVGLRARVPDSAGVGAMPGMITCGVRCERGLCEHTLGSQGAATRVRWTAAPAVGAGLCMSVTGTGAADFGACDSPEGDHVRLLGQISARGFDLVLAVERTHAASRTRSAEVWALVTRSARWQRMWQGPALDGSAPRLSRVALQGAHLSLCRDDDEGARCERIEALSFTPATDPRTTAAASLR